jgi:hypothetical protein
MAVHRIRRPCASGVSLIAEPAGPVRRCHGGLITRGPNDGAVWLSCRPDCRAWQCGLWPGLAVGADVADAGQRARGAGGGGARDAAGVNQPTGPAGAGNHRRACTARKQSAGAADRMQCQRLRQGLSFIPGGGLQLPAERRSAPALREIITTERTIFARVSTIFRLLGRQGRTRIGVLI